MAFVADAAGARRRRASARLDGRAARASRPTTSAFTYPSRRRARAARRLAATIEPGEVVALVGDNGSGKTTLAKLLARPLRARPRARAVGRRRRRDVDPRRAARRDRRHLPGLRALPAARRATTSASAATSAIDDDRRDRRRRRARPAPTTCIASAAATATRRSSARSSAAATTCRSGSGSASRSRARSSATRRS